MPLPKRVISPIHVSRDTLPEHLQLTNDLEGVNNGTLANIIRQLSSMSKHAEDMFGELMKLVEGVHTRTSKVQARVDSLAVKATQLDSTVEEVSLRDIHLRKAFRSNIQFDQQVVSKLTIPTAMADTYVHCDKPPPLDKLNCYRDDGKDGLKSYTNPSQFFELWRQDMLKDTERLIHDKGRKPRGRNAEGGRHKTKRVRQPHNTRDKHRENAIKQGEYITTHNNNGPYQQGPQTLYLEDGTVVPDASSTARPPRPNSIEVKRNYSSGYGGEDIYATQRNNTARSPQDNTYSGMHQPSNMQSASGSAVSRSRLPPGGMGGMASMGRDSLPPPPLPPIEDYGMMRISQLPDPPFISSVMVNAPPSMAPMAPPPPPLPTGGLGGAGSPPPVRESRESSTESELPLPPPPPLPAEMAPPPEVSLQAGPPPPPPPPMPMSSPPPRPPITNGDGSPGSSVFHPHLIRTRSIIK